MNQKRIIRKLFITTLSMFLILTINTLPQTSKEKVLRTNLEIEEITSLNTDTIYLLNKDSYLVQGEIFIDSNKIEEKVEKIIDYLTQENNKLQNGLVGYIPKDTKLLDYELKDKEIILNFSKELLNASNISQMITGIVYSLTEQKEIEEISIKIDNNIQEEYEHLTRKIGINKDYQIENRKDLERVVLYYLDSTKEHYVPVTRYLNSKKEKVEIIIEELKNTTKNLISLENNHTKLLDYREEDNILFLNFNNELLDENEESMEKVFKTIAYSVFDNYDVNMVVFEIEKEQKLQVSRR
mgnify:CR=1 FL=1